MATAWQPTTSESYSKQCPGYDFKLHPHRVSGSNNRSRVDGPLNTTLNSTHFISFVLFFLRRPRLHRQPLGGRHYIFFR